MDATNVLFPYVVENGSRSFASMEWSWLKEGAFAYFGLAGGGGGGVVSGVMRLHLYWFHRLRRQRRRRHGQQPPNKTDSILE